jgi:hypothetical protein
VPTWRNVPIQPRAQAQNAKSAFIEIPDSVYRRPLMIALAAV